MPDASPEGPVAHTVRALWLTLCSHSCMQRVYDAQTLEEIHMALEEAGRNLQQLQVFRKLHMLVHEAPAVIGGMSGWRADYRRGGASGA